MTANLDTLLDQLFKKGVDTEVTTAGTQIRVALTDLVLDETIGVATGNTPEEAFATIMRKLIDNNSAYKRDNANSLRSFYFNNDKLSDL